MKADILLYEDFPLLSSYH